MNFLRTLAGIGVLVAVALAMWGNAERRAVSTAPRAGALSELVSTSTPTRSVPDTYAVVKVVDGDTLDILVNDETVRVRLIGLDTPEIVDPRKPVQCFAREASAKAKEILTGQSVQLETDLSQDLHDKYGRLLAYIFLPDGTLFNKYMISEGYGHEYTYHLPYKYQAGFKAAEKTARENKKGLWADDTCAGNTTKPAP